jgi:hypothetical protein
MDTTNGYEDEGKYYTWDGVPQFSIKDQIEQIRKTLQQAQNLLNHLEKSYQKEVSSR